MIKAICWGKSKTHYHYQGENRTLCGVAPAGDPPQTLNRRECYHCNGIKDAPLGADYLVYFPYEDCGIFSHGDQIYYKRIGDDLHYYHPLKKKWLTSKRDDILKDAKGIFPIRGESIMGGKRD